MENNPNPNPSPEEGEKQFTQADLDRVVSKRLAEERSKYPTKEELDAYRAYKDSQKSDAEKLSTLTTERDTAKNDLAKAQAEIEKMKHERFLLSKGVPADDLEYFDFKISQQVTEGKDYETVAKAFLKEKLKPGVRVEFGGGFGGGNPAPTGNSAMNAFIRSVKR